MPGLAKETEMEKIHRLENLAKFRWEEINKPGAYVDVASGELYRIPKEGLLPSGSPAIYRESKTPSKFVRVSKNPLTDDTKARQICVKNNIKAKF
jgi:hypothetical protein